MCFGGKSSPAPQPTPPSPGVLDSGKVAPDPSQAYKYRGGEPAPNTTGRSGGTLLLDAANKQQLKTTTGQ
jgi:hypothetical protein